MLGLRTVLKLSSSRILFQYVHVNQHYDTGSEYGQILVIPVSFQIVRDNDSFTVRLTPPEKADLVTQSLLFLPPRKLGSTDELLDDFVNVMASMAGVKVGMQSLIQGELTSVYKPESVLGNFERLLGRHSYGYSEKGIYDLKRDNVFSYRVDQERFALKVAVFPYRDGTKVTYEASLPYKVSANGATEGFDLPQKLKVDIEKVLND
jgi:hypothetical protein